MDHGADHGHIKTFPTDCQMMPCGMCDLLHPLFPLIAVPFDCTGGLFLGLFHAVSITAVTLVYSDPYSVCYHIHLIHLHHDSYITMNFSPV